MRGSRFSTRAWLTDVVCPPSLCRVGQVVRPLGLVIEVNRHCPNNRRKKHTMSGMRCRPVSHTQRLSIAVVLPCGQMVSHPPISVCTEPRRNTHKPKQRYPARDGPGSCPSSHKPDNQASKPSFRKRSQAGKDDLASKRETPHISSSPLLTS